MIKEIKSDNILNDIIYIIDKKYGDGEQYDIIAATPELFKYVEDPSVGLQMFGVRMLGSNIQYISNQTPTIQELSILDDVENIQFIYDPTQSVLERSIKSLPGVLSMIKNIDDTYANGLACNFPELFKYIQNPSEYLCDCAVRKDPNNIEYVSNPSLSIQRIAYMAKPSLLNKINNLDDGLAMEILTNKPEMINLLKNPKDLHYKIAIRQDPSVILSLSDELIVKYIDIAKTVVLDMFGGNIDSITPVMVKEYPIIAIILSRREDFDNMMNIAISQNGDMLKVLHEYITDDMIPFILLQYGWFIKYMDKSKITENLILLSISGGQEFVIQYIDNVSERIQNMVILDDKKNIQYINKPMDSIINAAITESPFNIRFIKNPSDFICNKAIRKEPNCIQFIENQTEKMQFIAYHQNHMCAKYFTNPSTAIKMIVLSNNPEYINEDSFKLKKEDLENINITLDREIIINTDKAIILEYINKIKKEMCND